MSKDFRHGKFSKPTFGKHDSNPRKQSGFEPADDDYRNWNKKCFHPQHQPPQHLYVEAGKIYRHFCPGCNAETVLESSEPCMSDAAQTG